MASSIVVDGELVEGDRVSLAVGGDGLAYGFGLFETLKIRDSRPCFFQEHYDRHRTGLADAGMHLKYAADELYWQARSLIEAANVVDGAVKIATLKTEADCLTYIYFKRSAKVELDRTMRIALSSVARPSTGFVVRRKTLNYMENRLELSRAERRGFDECLFANEFGEITECSMANVFFVKSGTIKTPALDCGLLDGVIRGQVIRIAGEAGYAVVEGRFPIEEIAEADQVFVTSSGKGVAPVEEIDLGAASWRAVGDSGLLRSLSIDLDVAEKERIEKEEEAYGIR